MLRYQRGYIFNGYTFVVNKEDVHNAKDDMFVEATALLPDGWISVKDRLPERVGWYLVHIRSWITMAWFDLTGWDDFASCTANSEQVSHWMELPPPPGEEATDD